MRVQKPEKRDFSTIFLSLKQRYLQLYMVTDWKHYWKLLLRIFEVLQTTLGGNPTCSFRDI